MAATWAISLLQKVHTLALMIGCAIGDLLFIIPMMIVIGSNGTTSSSLSLTDSFLYGLAGWGILILFVEMIFIFVRDWRGAMTLRFDAGIAWTYRGRRARREVLVFTIVYNFSVYLFANLFDAYVDGSKACCPGIRQLVGEIFCEP